MSHSNRATAAIAMLALGALTSCAASRSVSTARSDDQRAVAIQVVAMHACDLIRSEAPTELDSLRETMAALNVLLRDQRADWGVISATFDQLPSRSKTRLALSAAMAKQYADNVGGYYDGLRRLTTGCLTALTVATPRHQSRETGQQSPPPASDPLRHSGESRNPGG